MNCKNCGAVIEDSDAKFCFMCGASVSDMKDSGDEDIIERETAGSIEPGSIEPGSVEPCSVEPCSVEDTDVVPDTPGVKEEIIKPEVITVSPESLRPVNPVKKSRAPFMVLTVLFALITVSAIACEFIQFCNWYSSKCFPRHSAIENTQSWVIYTNFAIFAAASVIATIYSFTKSKLFSAVKGLSISGLLAGEIILEGYSTLSESVKVIGSKSDFIDKYIAVMLISSFIVFYIFLFFDIIRSLFSLRKIAVFINFLGYFTALFMGITSVVLVATGANVLRLGFVPPMFYMITFTLTLIFAGMSRRRA